MAASSTSVMPVNRARPPMILWPWKPAVTRRPSSEPNSPGGKVVCANGDGFAYDSSGAWDSKGFRAAGSIVDGSGSGRFANAKGRVAQLGGTLAPTSGGTADVSFELVVDTVEG
jgi:hypothetical protein